MGEADRPQHVGNFRQGNLNQLVSVDTPWHRSRIVSRLQLHDFKAIGGSGNASTDWPHLPSWFQVGDTYADLGATVSDVGPGQAGDANRGYKTFLNGTLVSNITIDTSGTANYTIDYVATDSAALTARHLVGAPWCGDREQD
jgi:hypothetical protein